MKNKIVVLTGGNRGLGKAMAKEIAISGAHLIIGSRSLKNGIETKDELTRLSNNHKIDILELDLSMYDSIKDFTNKIKSKVGHIDVLINNAGLQTPSKILNEDGIENTFAVNVLGHHRITKLLTELLSKSDQARIINVASEFAGNLELDDINFERRKYSSTLAYKQSKQANRMETREWARKLADKKITVNSMSPGLVPETDLFRHQNSFAKKFLKLLGYFVGGSIENGADTAVWLALSNEVKDKTGIFFIKRKEIKCQFENQENEFRLFSFCEKYC